VRRSARLRRAIGVMRRLRSGESDWRTLRRALLLDAASWCVRPLVHDSAGDPYHETFAFFCSEASKRSGYRVLQLGSFGSPVDGRLTGWSQALGVDIRPGPNVDVVGDVHALSSLVPGRFDAVYSVSVFEHLAMPWQVVLELNRVTNIGGLVFVATHPTWPLHEEPWDFWRYSPHAFRVLFNERTGFELLRVEEGLPAAILSLNTERSAAWMHRYEAFLGVAMVARKIADLEASFDWGDSAEELLSTTYPGGSPHEA
jgi:Methyltransferase domain